MRTFVNMRWRYILLGVALGWAQQLQCYTAGSSNLPGNVISSIYVDGSDTAWIGTDNGLTWYANGTFRSSAVAWANRISECTKAPNGAVWCAFYSLALDGGVFRYHNGTLTWYRKNHIAPSYWYTSVLGHSIAMEGNTVWVGLFGAGLAKYDGTTWSWYHPLRTAGMPDSTVLAIAVDAQGRK
jgi:ligand-binding sensor domain-containing protein